MSGLAKLAPSSRERGVDAWGDPEERGVDVFGDRYAVNVADDGTISLDVNGADVALDDVQSAALRAFFLETTP